MSTYCSCGQLIHHPPPHQAEQLGVELDGWVHARGLRVRCNDGGWAAPRPEQPARAAAPRRPEPR